MELDLNSLNGKSILILGGVLIAVLLADRYQGIPRSMLLRWQYNSDRQTLTRDPDIAADLERKESLRLRALHKTINDELTTAELKGFEVSRLRSISDQALLLDNTIYRPAAFERLQKLRLAIPQLIEPFRPASDTDESDEHIATPRSRPKTIKKMRSH